VTIADMVRILSARVLLGEDKLDTPVYTACCSDLMSDVLAFVDEKTVLITGLTNPHVVRTSEMLDLKCLVFVRGKVPTDDILESADEQGLVVITTKLTAFSACGMLYAEGLRGVPVPVEWNSEDDS
jgi:predicted transcriptional regulator